MVSDNLLDANGIASRSNGDSSKYHYSSQYLGQPRSLRVALIDAGLSGIAAVKLFKERLSGLPTELVIYEKNEDVTGTWLENRYPGCSGDVPAHAYSYSWEGNPRWSKAYVGSQELYNHFKGRAVAYGIEEFIRLQHRVTKAVWDTRKGHWTLTVDDILHNRTITDEAEVVINACGFLNNWKWPEITDLMAFKGHLVHSARWDDSYLFRDKTIAIIGSGSSAIQIVPKLQPGISVLSI